MSSLAHFEHGDLAHPPLIILHGLFGSGRNWSTIARKLASHFRVFAVDLPNHGRSDWTDGPMDYPFMAECVTAWMDEQDLSRAAVIGHSMGGKTAMQVALRHPERIRALAVVDVAPVSYTHREHLSYITAMQAVSLRGVARRSQVETMLAETISNDLIRKFLTQNLVQDGDCLRWQINLEILRQSMSALLDFPLPNDLVPCAAPTYVLAGGASEYVQPRHEPVIKRLFPESTISRLEGGGHWLHAEHPALFLERVGGFLQAHR